MAFIVTGPTGGLRQRSSRSSFLPPRRQHRCVAVPRRRRLMACAQDEQNATQYPDISAGDGMPSTGQTALASDIEEGTPLLHSVPTNSVEQQPAPTGIVQTTSDLDRRVLFGEFLSTFIFVYLSINAAALGAPLANSLNNAAIIAAVAASFMPVSGAHLNPAVTLALLVTNRVSLTRAIAFIPIQLLAAAAACYLAQALGTTVAFAGLAISATKTEILRAFFAELIPMFIIVIVVFQTAVATEREGGVGMKLAALYIGLAVLACAGTFVSGVFNPARAFGPAVVVKNFTHHWVYWLGPFLGAMLAAFISEHLFLAPASNRPANSWLSFLERKSSDMGNRIKTLGVAGLIAYGIMNTTFYGLVFTIMMLRVGLHSGASGLAQAWLVTWSLSQVTKPLRLAVSIALAPVIERFLRIRKLRKGRSR